jgi:hypothetical protein
MPSTISPEVAKMQKTLAHEVATASNKNNKKKKTLRPYEAARTVDLSSMKSSSRSLRSLTPNPPSTSSAVAAWGRQASKEEPPDSPKLGVSGLLKRLEGRMEETSPLVFAVSGVPMQKKDSNSSLDSNNTNKHQQLLQKSTTTSHFLTNGGGKAAAPSASGGSRVIVGELEKRIHEEELTKIAKRNVRKESTSQKSVGDELREKSTVKSSLNEVIASLQKKTTTSERSSSSRQRNNNDVVMEDFARTVFQARTDQFERMANAYKKMEGGVDSRSKLGIENQSKVNNVIATKNRLTLEDRLRIMAKSDNEEGLLELQRKRLRNVQVKEHEQKPVGQETKENSVIVVKRVKKKKKRRVGIEFSFFTRESSSID